MIDVLELLKRGNYLPHGKFSEYLRISNGYLIFSKYDSKTRVIDEGLGDIFEDETEDESEHD